MASSFTESIVEAAALGWLEELGYAVLHGPDIAAGELDAERSDPAFRDVVLEGRLRSALARLNPKLPPEALEDAFRKLTRIDAPSLVERNRAVHRMLVKGIAVEYRREDGSIAGDQARVLDFEDPDNNDWLAVSHPTVTAGELIAERRAANSRDVLHEWMRPASSDQGYPTRVFRSAEYKHYDWPLAKLAMGRPSELQSADACP